MHATAAAARPAVAAVQGLTRHPMGPDCLLPVHSCDSPQPSIADVHAAATPPRSPSLVQNMPFRCYLGYDSHEDITFEVRAPQIPRISGDPLGSPTDLQLGA
jgi:hypothetical protein